MIWFDGELTCDAQMQATNAGTLLGWGIFTTLAIRDGAPVFWAHHVARLRRDAAAARVEFPFDEAQLRAGLDALIRHENIANGLARITGTQRGDGRWNAQTGAHWSIVEHEASPPSSAPLNLTISPSRVAAQMLLAGVKTTSYLPYLLAWQTAREAGFDEALLLTESGWICEGARASIFWARNGQLFTPSLACGCLRGVGRQIVSEQWDARAGEWNLADLWEADEAFLVSGATGARPIGALCDAKQTRRWDGIGPITAQIRARWFDAA